MTMLKEYREAIIFLVKYVVIYVALNTVYAWYVAGYLPDADPLTVVVTRHTEGLLCVFDASVASHVVAGSQNVPITKDGTTVMSVYEGCNSINVMIVFVAFIIAFKGPFKLFLRYLMLGLLGVYLINLLRLVGLYGVSLHFPANFYFFHKFFFTGVIYLFVFLIWYFWISAVKRWRLRETVSV
jgi:exosortase family protein XrtF